MDKTRQGLSSRFFQASQESAMILTPRMIQRSIKHRADRVMEKRLSIHRPPFRHGKTATDLRPVALSGLVFQ